MTAATFDQIAEALLPTPPCPRWCIGADEAPAEHRLSPVPMTDELIEWHLLHTAVLSRVPLGSAGEFVARAEQVVVVEIGGAVRQEPIEFRMSDVDEVTSAADVRALAVGLEVAALRFAALAEGRRWSA